MGKFHVVLVGKEKAVTHQMVALLALPASSARQSVRCCQLSGCQAKVAAVTCSRVLRGKTRTARKHGAADDDSAASRWAAAGRFNAGGRAGQKLILVCLCGLCFAVDKDIQRKAEGQPVLSTDFIYSKQLTHPSLVLKEYVCRV